MTDRGHRNEETSQGDMGTLTPSLPVPLHHLQRSQSPQLSSRCGSFLSFHPQRGQTGWEGPWGLVMAGDLCGSFFPLADLCAASLPKLPATLARGPGDLSAQPLPRCCLGKEGVDFQLLYGKNQPSHHFPQRPAGREGHASKLS